MKKCMARKKSILYGATAANAGQTYLVPARRAQRTNQGSPQLPQFQQSAGATPLQSLWGWRQSQLHRQQKGRQSFFLKIHKRYFYLFFLVFIRNVYKKVVKISIILDERTLSVSLTFELRGTAKEVQNRSRNPYDFLDFLRSWRSTKSASPYKGIFPYRTELDTPFLSIFDKNWLVLHLTHSTKG